MSNNAMLITYNRLPTIPIGRQVVGEMIVISGDYGRDSFLYETHEKMGEAFRKDKEGFLARQKEQREKAEREAKRLINSLQMDDIEKCGTIIIYIGVYALGEMFNLARSLKPLEKNILIIACDCYKEYKKVEALNIDIPIHFTNECGGGKTCEEFIKGWNSKK